MFDKHIHKHIDYSKGLERASSRICSQMELDRKSKENIAQKEIKARNRVDISLEEYERMKDEISSLRCEVNQMRNRLEQFNEVVELNIVSDTMNILYDHNIIDNTMRCIIRFEFIPERGKKYY